MLSKHPSSTKVKNNNSIFSKLYSAGAYSTMSCLFLPICTKLMPRDKEKRPNPMSKSVNQEFWKINWVFKFTGQSCYSCRAFFRRTSPRPISSFRCRSGLNNCTINSGSKSCIPCRLTKCIQVSFKLNSKNWFIFCLLILCTIQHRNSLWLCWQNDLYESKGLFP